MPHYQIMSNNQEDISWERNNYSYMYRSLAKREREREREKGTEKQTKTKKEGSVRARVW